MPAEFETLSSQQVEFNNGGEFFELSVGVVRDGKRESKYLRVARGYYNQEGEPRYKKGGLTLPIDRAAIDQLAEALKAWDISDIEKEKAAAPPAAAPAPAAKKASKKKAADEDEE